MTLVWYGVVCTALVGLFALLQLTIFYTMIHHLYYPLPRIPLLSSLTNYDDFKESRLSRRSSVLRRHSDFASIFSILCILSFIAYTFQQIASNVIVLCSRYNFVTIYDHSQLMGFTRVIGAVFWFFGLASLWGLFLTRLHMTFLGSIYEYPQWIFILAVIWVIHVTVMWALGSYLTYVESSFAWLIYYYFSFAFLISNLTLCLLFVKKLYRLIQDTISTRLSERLETVNSSQRFGDFDKALESRETIQSKTDFETKLENHCYVASADFGQPSSPHQSTFKTTDGAIDVRNSQLSPNRFTDDNAQSTDAYGDAKISDIVYSNDKSADRTIDTTLNGDDVRSIDNTAKQGTIDEIMPPKKSQLVSTISTSAISSASDKKEAFTEAIDITGSMKLVHVMTRHTVLTVMATVSTSVIGIILGGIPESDHWIFVITFLIALDNWINCVCVALSFSFCHPSYKVMCKTVHQCCQKCCMSIIAHFAK